MDAKTLYFDAVKHFLTRNRAVLPQVQLQTGANERGSPASCASA